jgi:cobalamin biosynthetic protein CobC
VAIVTPTYAEHEHTWRKGGAYVEKIKKGEPVPRLCNVAIVVNPNNPDANIHKVDELVALACEMKTHNGYLIVDEAFCDPYPEHSIIPHLLENMLVYRSFGKFFGLAGLRLGFLIGAEAFVHPLENLLGPWCVSGPALEIGRRAFNDKNWIKNTRTRLDEMAKKQAEMIGSHGLEIHGTNPLFVFAGHDKATEIFNSLARQNILVRPFPEIPDRLRFGLCKDQHDLDRLSGTLKLAMEQV